MKPTNHPPFDPGMLLSLAGEKSFARGQDYADHGQISVLSANGKGVLAAAFGTDDYTVWLQGLGSQISGRCTCPAYEDSGFCKHMVATGLVANELAEHREDIPDRTGAIAAGIAKLERLRLEKLLLEIVTADWRVLRSLHFALDLDWEDDLD